MRTTINVDDQVLREIKKIVAESGKTLAAVIEEALREKLARCRQAEKEVKWIVKPSKTKR